MTDDLVKRLRSRKAYTPEYDFHGDEIIGDDPDEDCQNAADRIEALEAALRWYADVCYSDLKMSQHLMGPSGDYGDIARAALGEKKDG